MARNVELLEKVMQHINDHPKQHDQEIWVDECGTAGCFFGWACLLSGWKPGFVENINARGLATVYSPDGLLERDPFDVGAELLGLDVHDATILSNQNNTIAELQLMVKDLVNGDRLMTASEVFCETGVWPVRDV